MSEDRAPDVARTDFGFKWGVAEVVRMSTVRGSLCLRVVTDAGKHIDVYVSPQGNSIRVFSGGEWKP
jgi:hypothetical protein